MKLTATLTQTVSYWNIANKKPPIDADASVIRKTLFDKMNEAVGKRMMSDVPMGAFLSGGIDSSAVVALMSLNASDKINTFNLSFTEKEYDELRPFLEKINSNVGDIVLRALLALGD